MKNLLITLLMSGLALSMTAQSNFRLSHGPYLQEIATDGVTVAFQTSEKAFSWIEVKPHGACDDEVIRCYSSKDGLKAAYNAFSFVRLDNLKAGKEYDYRIISKEMRSFQPYKVVFGDSIATKWYMFSTIDPNKKGAS